MQDHPGFHEATGKAALYFFTLPANRMSVLRLLADIGVEISDVRFTLKTGHAPHLHRCPFCARSGLPGATGWRSGPDKLRVTEQILSEARGTAHWG